MSTVNLYDVLNVDSGASKKEIKVAYKELAKKYHPDKKDGDKEMFELVTHAYNVLQNDETRANYDSVYKLSQMSDKDHFKMKDAAKDFYKAQESELKKISIDEQRIEFDKRWKEMDKKRGFDSSIKEVSLTEKDTKSRLEDIKMARQQDDIDNMHENLFKDKKFDLSKFNAAFDMLKSQQKKDALVHKTDAPDPFNFTGASNFAGLDAYDTPFVDGGEVPSNMTFAPVGFNETGTISTKFTQQNIDDLVAAEYTTNHNKKETNYDEMIKKRLADRESETSKYNNREYGDFQRSFDKYGIHDQLGIDATAEIVWDDSESISAKYKRLLQLRKQEEEGDDDIEDVLSKVDSLDTLSN
jgi:curved DNA-binding protein CbpA